MANIIILQATRGHSFGDVVPAGVFYAKELVQARQAAFYPDEPGKRGEEPVEGKEAEAPVKELVFGEPLDPTEKGVKEEVKAEEETKEKEDEQRL